MKKHSPQLMPIEQNSPQLIPPLSAPPAWYRRKSMRNTGKSLLSRRQVGLWNGVGSGVDVTQHTATAPVPDDGATPQPVCVCVCLSLSFSLTLSIFFLSLSLSFPLSLFLCLSLYISLSLCLRSLCLSEDAPESGQMPMSVLVCRAQGFGGTIWMWVSNLRPKS